MAKTMLRNCLSLILVILVTEISFLHAKDGFIFTMPESLYHGHVSEFCVTMHGDVDVSATRSATVTFLHKESGLEVLKFEETFTVGMQKCVKFVAPPAGEYNLLLYNSTDILHDLVQVNVGTDKLITLVQTDKPMYKPGQTVKFRILTILRDMKPRTGKIDSIYILDPNDSRVKQYLDIGSEGISSLQFQLGKEAKLGDWKIEVNVDKEKEIKIFTVKEYVLPRFEVEVEPPSFILSSDELVTGKVCGKYTYGKPVFGTLSLDVCWTSAYGPPQNPCHHEVVQLEGGCHNFTVNMTEIRAEQAITYFSAYSQLEVRAKITEGGTGVEVSYNHTGPGITNTPLRIELDDYSNAYFKPKLPYYGKVKVLKPDGSVAVGENIKVTAEDDDNSFLFAKNFTTDQNGLIVFALCGGLSDNTTTLSITAEAVDYSDDTSGSPRSMYRPKTSRRVTQWFSPSHSYIQIPRPEPGHRCGERLTLPVAYTTRADVNTKLNYHVIARGKVIQTGEIEKEKTTPQDLGVTMPRSSMCLTQSEVLANTDGDGLRPDPPMADQEYPIAVDDMSPLERDLFQEPVVRSAHVSGVVSSILLDMRIEPIMAPEFKLLVYHVMPDGEVVADSMTFDVEPCFDNTVSMSFNTSQALPGETVGINLEAAPGSLCGVGVVDKSVNILGGDHQITPATVLKEIEKLSMHQPIYRNDYDYCKKKIKDMEDLPETDDMYWQYSSPYADASQAFSTSGMIVLTDLTLETRPCRRSPPIYYAVNNVPGQMPGPVGQREVETASGPALTVRSHFPETWLWDLHLVGSSGKAEISETAPHTVTNWNGNAMCIDSEQGLGLSEMTSLTTFQPFFLSVHMPYAAVRSERLPVMLTVYNYLEKCITVQLTLDLGDVFRVHNSRQYRSPVCVCSGEAFTAKYYVTPREIGTHPVIATAAVVAGRCRKSVDIDLDYVGVADQVHRKMKVKAEGVEQSYTFSSFVCRKEGENATEEVFLDIPDKSEIVRQSSKAQVQVIGDIMGPALSNLNDLVRMPTGCGEQNMVGFVPNILVLEYLSQVGGLDEKIEAEAKTNMEAGYQRELNYRHDDGSFSAFGKKDSAGSVWLTAFVVKSFAHAKAYVYIDEKDLDKSIEFLRRSQLETGCYRETGKVFSSYMMGGLGTGRGRRRETPHAALTAYVLVALLYAGVDHSTPTIVNGLECMNREFKSRERRVDTYTLSIVAYANMLYNADTQDAKYIFNQLNSKVVKDGSSMYWSRGSQKPPATSTWYYQAAPSAEVEMTSYALMANLLAYSDSAVEKTHAIAMWLNRQRNPLGGFASTQDTVIGLEALAEFAGLAYTDEPTELQVKLTTGNGTPDSDGQTRVFNVSESQGNTKYLLQSMPVNTLPTKLYIDTQGTGCALVQAHVKYNKLPKALLKGSRPKFTLRVRTRPYQHDPDRCDRRSVSITASARRNHKFNKGMSLLTVRMVTGWTPVADSITYLNSQSPVLGMKRVEYDESEALLTFYFDEFSRRHKTVVVDIEQDSELKVSRPKPGDVKIFEYYEKDVANAQTYRVKTTCGTKLSIPRNRPPVPGEQGRMNFPMQRRVEFQPRRTSAAANPLRRGTGCPVCHTVRQLPEDFDAIVCNASHVYKALSGRTGAMPIKIRQDIRPQQNQNMNDFAAPDMESTCSPCRLLSTQGGVKRVLIITSNEVSSKSLPLDSKSFILKTSRKIEKAISKALKTCPIAG